MREREKRVRVAKEPCVLKKEGVINHINPHSKLACSLCLRVKIEHYQLNSCLFEAAFSVIGRDLCSPGDSIFFRFYFADLYYHAF